MKRSKFTIIGALLGCFALGGALFCGLGVRASAAGTAPAAETASAPVLSDTYQAETALINPPTVVCDVRSSETLGEIKSSLSGERPASAILHINAEKDVVDGSGKSIGGLDETVQAIRAAVIPILAVSTQAEADAAVSYLGESGLLDTAILSENADLVKRVRDACPSIRGVVHLSGKTPYECVKTSSLAKAGVVMLDLDEADYDTVTFLQARFKAVWAAAEDETDMFAAITSGAYGIVTEDFSLAYRAICSFASPVYARMPFNVCHRGLPTTHNENSVSGTLAAIEAGGTHVELDGMLTTDNEIVMMHDDSVGRTAEGSGNIESMTLAEAKKHKLDLFEPKEEIPTLKEIIPLFEESDAVLVFELKSKGTDIVTRLKEILDETDFYEHIVVIAFGYEGLARMQRELPEVPVADLNAYSEANFAQKLPTLGQYNCAISTNGSSTKTFNEKYLRDRGIIGWYWTQADESAVDTAFARGLTGLTNNVGAHIGAKEHVYRVVKGDPALTKTALSVGGEQFLWAERYGGEQTQVEGKIAFLADRGDYYDVISEYDEGGMTYFTPVYRMRKGGDLVKKGCSGAIGLGASLFSLSVLFVSALLLLRRRS